MGSEQRTVPKREPWGTPQSSKMTDIKTSLQRIPL